MGDQDDPVIISTQGDNLGALLCMRDTVMDSKGFFARKQHATLLSSVEFQSGIKEIQQQKSSSVVLPPLNDKNRNPVGTEDVQIEICDDDEVEQMSKEGDSLLQSHTQIMDKHRPAPI